MILNNKKLLFFNWNDFLTKIDLRDNTEKYYQAKIVFS